MLVESHYGTEYQNCWVRFPGWDLLHGVAVAREALTLQVRVRLDGGATNTHKNYIQMTIKFKKLTDKAIQPVRATNSGAGYNLTAVSATTEVNERGQMILVYHTNLSVEIPEGFEGVIRPCNSICAKTLRMCDSPSVISGSMDDEIVVRFVITTDVIPAVYKEGDQIAQLVINKVEDVEFVEFIDTTENKEPSAAEGPQSLPETEGEPTNSETATDASGETTNGLEEAQ